MKILIASSEVFPFSKSGGLADMVGSLALGLGKLGHQVQVMTPFYRGVREKFPQVPETEWVTHVTLGGGNVYGGIRRFVWQENVEILFVEHEGFFGRAGLYGEWGQDYHDNAARFAFFVKAIWHWVRFGPFHPEIIHLHDWQTSMFPMIWKHLERSGEEGEEEEVAPPRTVLTIHNLAYQGVFPSHQFPLWEMPWDYFNDANLEFYGQWNCLKAGIVHADLLTTVSPQYALEIQTSEFGCGLEGVLEKRKDHLYGILNGVDYEEWKTVQNPWLPVSYNAKSIGFKTRMKQRLQEELGLPVDGEIPVFANIGRIVEQKGMDILIPSIRELLQNGTPLQYIQLGTGDPHYESQIHRLSEEFPSQVAVQINYNHGLAHRIEAGADFFLMPSRFEPCGLNQLYSLRYGTVPIVRAIGGLHDSVTDISENFEGANGFKFYYYTVDALMHVIKQALYLYEDKYIFNKFRKKGMERDFSSLRTAERYAELYERTERISTKVINQKSNTI